MSQPLTLHTLPIARPLFGLEEAAALTAVLAERWVGAGPRTARFEARLAELCQVPHVVALSSGTAALHLALLAAGMGPGSTVAVPSFTFVATANAVLLAGATPLLIDCDPATYNLDVADLRRKVAMAGGRVAAVLPVHQFGLPCDLAGVEEVARAAGALILEDAACALGAAIGDRPVGGLGTAGCLSFHPRKIVTTGEGGAVLTADPELAQRLRLLRSHGMDPTTDSGGGLADVVHPGFNYRLSDLQAALGLVQLDRLPALLADRARLAGRYQERLGDVPWLLLPAAPAGVRHGWQAYVVRIVDPDLQRGFWFREALRRGLEDEGIATRPGTHAVHGLRHYRERFGFVPESLPGAWTADRLTLALPFYSDLGDEGVDRVAGTLLELGTALRRSL